MTLNQEELKFLQDWCKEFVRVLEMFTGTSAKAVCGSNAVPMLDELQSKQYTWWKQAFKGHGTFTSWIGAREAAWSSLGSAMAEGAEGAKELYVEMLGHAQEAAAALLGGRLGRQIKPLIGQLEETCTQSSSTIFEIRVTFGTQELPPLLYAVDSGLAAMTLQHDSDQTGASGPPGAGRIYGSMIDDLLDLQLPLSVALGRSVMPIGDVLKITPGSLIELDTKIGGNVDLFVHGKLVARGEVVSVKGNYGVRIKQISSKEERLALNMASGQQGSAAL
ncbi:MAG: FliM/FliN family flagellar motor switch protein [Acidobacteriota bacterium]|nr:FliM/FliN family flagellar motor switch protein [Acidobacteriota bacterium]